MTDKPNVLQIYHVNINCSDFERALAFYELIGFRQIVDLNEMDGRPLPTLGEQGLGPVLALPNDCAGRAALLALGGDPRATRLDLIEWTTPRSPPRAPRDLSHLGIARLCLKVRDAQALYDTLTAHGYVTYSPPTLVELAGTREWVFCCEDPDGAVIEFMQFRGA